jgi:flagellar FliL protein
MAMLVVLSVTTAGVAVYLAWDANSDGTGEEQEQGQAKTTEQKARQAPIFVDIEPFTINVSSSSGTNRLLYIGMTFKVGDQQTRQILEDHKPQVRSRLLMTISEQKVDELTQVDGKKRLAEKLIAALETPPLTEPPIALAIDEVLFTEFIVQ